MENGKFNIGRMHCVSLRRRAFCTTKHSLCILLRPSRDTSGEPLVVGTHCSGTYCYSGLMIHHLMILLEYPPTMCHQGKSWVSLFSLTFTLSLACLFDLSLLLLFLGRRTFLTSGVLLYRLNMYSSPTSFLSSYSIIKQSNSWQWY